MLITDFEGMVYKLEDIVANKSWFSTLVAKFGQMEIYYF